MSRPPTGEQWTLEHGTDRLTVVEVGGGLREWTRAGRDVLAGYDVREECTSGRGQQLIPWPNRIRDGQYDWAGTAYQLPLSEPALGNASHGLVRWVPWRLISQSTSSLTVGFQLHPQPGWPGQLDLTTTYAVSAQGLTVTSSATNVGSGAVPFGYGAHPYVAIGETPVEEVEVAIPAATLVDVDERLLPVGRLAVEESGGAQPDLDFRTRRPIGVRRLDTAYTDLARDADGRWRVVVAVPDRPAVTVWGDTAFDWVQVFSGKAEADQSGAHGVAVEPMTCPADAFRSGEGVLTLEPGATWSGTWGIDPG
jgi:aldose 1-epimerase